MVMKPTVVLYPLAAMGHVVPIVQLAKLFIRHDFDAAVVLMHSHLKHPSFDPFIAGVSATQPSITFHQLPPPTDSVANPASQRLIDSVRRNNPQLLQFISSYRRDSDIRAVVLDSFCADALDVTAELRLRTHFFFSSGASDLGVFLYLPTMHAAMDVSFGDLGDAPLHYPGMPPIPASHMPSHMMERENEMFKKMVRMFDRLPDADAILINSFDHFEAEAVETLRSGVCVPGRRMPSVYCVGPLVVDARGGIGERKEERPACLEWLDAQPRCSVTFLCFGSMGSFSVDQLKQIATGLERSGQRFLWVVRAPPSGEAVNVILHPSEPDLDALLPEGFLERTKQRGMVVKSWAPQVEVLNHAAVGGFVTHCGWNSTLEAITAGVAMVAWPLYAEQRLNKVFLVDQMKLAVAMEGYDKEMVMAEEVETKLRWVMESEGGRELRERAAEMKTKAEDAMREGGASQLAMLEVIAKDLEKF
ncbi:anthocyanidin 5,3-O-glucosyltransferase-like [Zingiber officinale]|uniref:anthocyanidin 5,3-O-glucosyltransferase-like n=1 Tax=Zingiber officinale TaxID=94328 RepID=UPI001C4B83EC|nr:anthocyanidin 5,3-O-glucosyltransferase-like [Zingiber officinale]